MPKFNELLSLRLRKKSTENSKMSALAKQTTSGNLSSFSGIFGMSKLSDTEKNMLSDILKNYSEDSNNLKQDYESLLTITAEVKAITNQAVLLHGERIKKAQQILKNYKEGAFTAWLIATYGNRQTPYNFLQYFEFYSSMPPALRTKIDSMPRQAVYTLASRQGDVQKKEELVNSYQGQAKKELLIIIRKMFPLDHNDKRNANVADQIIKQLKQVLSLFSHPLFLPNSGQKKQLTSILKKMKNVNLEKVSTTKNSSL